MLVRACRLLFRRRDMSEGLSNHLCHPDRNAIELLKLVRICPELVHGLDILSPQHLPGDGGQIETLNRSCAGIINVGHRKLLSLAGGSTRISQPSVPGSFKPAMACCTPLPNIPPAQFLQELLEHHESYGTFCWEAMIRASGEDDHRCILTIRHGQALV
jgi:hypothetical protein